MLHRSRSGEFFLEQPARQSVRVACTLHHGSTRRGLAAHEERHADNQRPNGLGVAVVPCAVTPSSTTRIRAATHRPSLLEPLRLEPSADKSARQPRGSLNSEDLMNAPYQPSVRYRTAPSNQPDRHLPLPQLASNGHRPILHLNSNVAARTPLNRPDPAHKRHLI